MNNKKVLLILILVFVIVLGGAYTLYTNLGSTVQADSLAVQEKVETEKNETEAAQEEVEESVLGPDFVVYDADGNEVRLHDFLGKPIVLNFWASWCGPCQLEMPDFEAKYLELGEEVQFLMVNVTDGSRETVETASQFISEKGYSFPVYFDTDRSAVMAYGVYSYPTTYFIDRNGEPLARASGAIGAETLQKGIDIIK